MPDAWEYGDPYEQYVGRWSRRIAPRFLDWLAIGPGRRWLDVGCGTGALSSTIAERSRPSYLAGVEPSEGFLRTARERLAGRAVLQQGNAAAIPLANASVDVVVSALVLNFVPDPLAALAEMRRVAVLGGTVAAYVWDYAAGMELIRFFWDSAIELDPGAAKLDEAERFPLCGPQALKDVFTAAGLAEVEGTAIETPTVFADFDDYWRPFLGAQGPAPGYAMSLDETARARLRQRLRERLPVDPAGAIALSARAWAIRGIVEGREVAGP
jgi:SAM-dependent methyltransferase